MHQHLRMRMRIEHAKLEHAQAEAGDVEAERGDGIEGDRSRLDIAALHVDDRVRPRVHQVDEHRVLRGVSRADVDRQVTEHRDVAVDLDRLGAVDVERAQRERRARGLDAQHIVDRRQVIRQDLVAAVERDVQGRPRHGIRRAAEAEVDGERILALAADREPEHGLRVDIDRQDRVGADEVALDDAAVAVVDELEHVFPGGAVLAEAQQQVRAGDADRVVDVRRLRERAERRRVRRHLRLGDGDAVRVRRGGIAESREVERSVLPVGKQLLKCRTQELAFPQRVVAGPGFIHEVGPACAAVGVLSARRRQRLGIAVILNAAHRAIAYSLEQKRAGDGIAVGLVAELDVQVRAGKGVCPQQPESQTAVFHAARERRIACGPALVYGDRLGCECGRPVLDRVLRVGGRMEVLIGMRGVA